MNSQTELSNSTFSLTSTILSTLLSSDDASAPSRLIRSFPASSSTTTLTLSVNDPSGSFIWTPVIVTGFLIVLTWLANCILLGGALQTASNGKSIPVVYFFIGSQAISALLHVTLNLPPAVVHLLFGSPGVYSYVHVFCLYSIYLDTLFCNLNFLQTFFSSLDAYLRLRNPIFYLASARRRPAMWLKVGSPWLVAGLQAIGQLALSDRRYVSLHLNTAPKSMSDTTKITTASMDYSPHSNMQTACLLPDPNFLIIRTAIAYALPLITCIILVGLQIFGLRQLRHYSPDTLVALLRVRNGISDNDYLGGLKLPVGMCSPQSTLSPRISYFPTRHNLLSNKCQKIWTDQDHICLQPLSCTKRRKHGGDGLDSVALMTNSLHLEPAYTIETLVPEGSQNLNSIRSPTPSISHVILTPESIPFLDLAHTTKQVSIHTSTNNSTILSCPQHGPITMTRSVGTLPMATLPESNSLMTSMIGLNTPMEKRQPRTTDPITTDAILLNLDGTELKLLPVSYKCEIKNSQSAQLLETDQFTNKTICKSCSDQQINQSNASKMSNEFLTAGKSKYPIPTEQDPKRHNTLWLTAYQGEQLAVAINLVSCIIAVGIWSPYILATLAHGLCQPIYTGHHQHVGSVSSTTPKLPNFMPIPLADGINTLGKSRCWIQVTADRLADFRWWAYASSGLLLPILLFFLDLGLREGCWRALSYSGKPVKQNEHQSGRANRIQRTNR